MMDINRNIRTDWRDFMVKVFFVHDESKCMDADQHFAKTAGIAHSTGAMANTSELSNCLYFPQNRY